MAGVFTLDFEHPNESRTIPHGRVDIVRAGPSTVARMSLEPGWQWANDVKPIVGTDNCQARHVGYMQSGQLRVMMADGAELDIGPGEAYVIEPGHDAKVVGSDSVVAYEFTTETAEGFARIS